MKEELTTFKTVQKAKEAGFDWLCRHAYQGDRLVELPYYDGDGTGLIHNNMLDNTTSGEIYEVVVPTQSLLQKYLREEHGVYVEVVIDTYKTPNTLAVIIKILDGNREYIDDEILPWTKIPHFKIGEYKKALEKGLQEGIKLVLNN